MTALVDICNRALQAIGTRTDVTSAELAANSTNEAKQFNLIFANVRDDLTRMAPWNATTNCANLTYITSVPGTPENTSPATTFWQKGQPMPPYAYEYQYPVDCLRGLYVIPANQTGQSGGVPITTAITGGGAQFWWGNPVRFKVGIDQFYPVTAAVVAAGGANYAVGDLITLASGPTTSPPIGAPAVLQVATLAGSAVVTVNVINQIGGSASPLGGSYFSPRTNPVAQGSTTGSGTGATFTLTFGAQGDQRVILTNQEYATLVYCKQVTNPDVMDTLFQSAWIQILAANMAVALTGDKQLANLMIGLANKDIEEARKPDGNEGWQINDVTPDWIRTRGYAAPDNYLGPNAGFDWGPTYPLFV